VEQVSKFLEQVSKLRFSDFFEGEDFKSIDRLDDSTGVAFSLITYLRLSTALHHSLRVKVDFTGKSCSIEDYLRVKNGVARKIQTAIDFRAQCKKTLYSFTPIKTFFRLLGTNIDVVHHEEIFSFWNEHYLCNKLRDFCYKYFYNMLPVNVRLSHYVQNTGRGCTFCTITCNNNNDIPDETFVHLFLDCPTTVRIHNWFLNKYFLNVTIDRQFKMDYFFFGRTPGTGNFNKFGFAIAMTIQFLVWDLKQQKRALSPLSIENDFVFLLGSNVKASVKFAAQRLKVVSLNNGALTFIP
jgi:hypothetical protein